MGAYILEIKAVIVRGGGPVGYGVDDLGREFTVALDRDLAADVAMAIEKGRRPIIAVESGRPIPLASRRASDGATRFAGNR